MKQDKTTKNIDNIGNAFLKIGIFIIIGLIIFAIGFAISFFQVWIGWVIGNFVSFFVFGFVFLVWVVVLFIFLLLVIRILIAAIAIREKNIIIFSILYFCSYLAFLITIIFSSKIIVDWIIDLFASSKLYWPWDMTTRLFTTFLNPFWTIYIGLNVNFLFQFVSWLFFKNYFENFPGTYNWKKKAIKKSNLNMVFSVIGLVPFLNLIAFVIIAINLFALGTSISLIYIKDSTQQELIKTTTEMATEISTKQIKKCPNCGKYNKFTADFCIECGKEI